MPRQTWPNRLLALAFVAGAPACGAIEIEDAAGKRAPKESWPERVEVSASTLTVGTATGTLRWEVAVDGFAFSRFPTTNQQYQDCILSGACRTPSLRGGSCEKWPRPGEEAGMLEWPVSCATPEEASSFCRYVGANGLPTDEQWTLASRGRKPTRFAWGNSAPSCKTHPSGPPQGENSGCAAPGDARIRIHADGASPFGAEDVLAFRSELLRKNPDSHWPGCRTARGCYVRGVVDGAIDGYIGYPSVETERAHAQGVPLSTFRCVWE